eukprot:CAMPEP_0183458964 /NCGR_PEP_ID=MMETSP0370-20130417/134583_1 /TAXON_ID=268820 /ORGANISM="Peridinium aciculiferum, Strain PAER-2" /LENGTH=356 /DNA_ID=CAMNT_0025650777 /DNA_START=99 /DNA_END=1166 /DNA_ORIENTATION=+
MRATLPANRSPASGTLTSCAAEFSAAGGLALPRGLMQRPRFPCAAATPVAAIAVVVGASRRLRLRGHLPISGGRLATGGSHCESHGGRPGYALCQRAALNTTTSATVTDISGSAFEPKVWRKELRACGRGAHELREALQQDGLIRVEVHPDELAALDAALGHFESKHAFRYPLVAGGSGDGGVVADEEDDDAPPMPLVFGRSFNVLYRIANTAAQLLRSGETAAAETSHRILPPPCSDGFRPFEGDGGPWPYSSSFFNIFNYDCGCLNTHRDRGVLTLVYGVGGAPADTGSGPGSRLWFKVPGPEGLHWVPAENSQLLLWAGDCLGLAGVESVEHNVRVNPDGAYIDRSHHLRDPA